MRNCTMNGHRPHAGILLPLYQKTFHEQLLVAGHYVLEAVLEFSDECLDLDWKNMHGKQDWAAAKDGNAIL